MMISEFGSNGYRNGRADSPVTVWTPPAAILEVAAEEHDLISELIESYITDMQSRLQRIRTAMRASNTAILRSEIHTIKGSSKQMGANSVSSVCEHIELSGDRPLAYLASLVDELDVRIAETSEAMLWYQRASR
ncbi:MAG TPA: Hpt domain-containing protein [Bryobacteraceae bacterium]|nr:Hpt domain-containing protein [Bryobacteraceae bacterium]